MENGARQVRQRPLSQNQESTGTLWKGLMAVPHAMQCDGGQTTDWPNGTRAITTLRKLPTTAPMTKAKQVSSQTGIP
ncbi:MAG: hypothetical protein QM765_22835 [Myxococcales bacterium]